MEVEERVPEVLHMTHVTLQMMYVCAELLHHAREKQQLQLVTVTLICVCAVLMPLAPILVRHLHAMKLLEEERVVVEQIQDAKLPTKFVRQGRVCVDQLHHAINPPPLRVQLVTLQTINVYAEQLEQ